MQNVYKLLQEKLVPILGANPNIYYVPETKQEQVLKYLTDPDYVGCSHLHAIMMFPAKYNVRHRTHAHAPPHTHTRTTAHEVRADGSRLPFRFRATR
jgi:hypothetical protein